MKRTICFIIISIMFLGCVGYLHASTRGTKTEAEALAAKAAAYIQTHGKEKALAEFNNPKGAFVDRDLYIFAYDFSGVNKASGNNPTLVGTNLLEKQDADGNYLIKGLIDVAKKGGGWYNYKWANPVTNEVQGKSSYVIKVDDTLWLGCGVYL